MRATCHLETMAQFAATVRTEKPAEEVFAFISDLTNFAVWDPGVESSTQVSGDGPGLGAAYEVKASGAELVYEVVEFDVPNRIVAEAKTKLLHSYDVISVEVRQGSTYVTYDATLSLNGPLAIGDVAFGVMFDKIAEKAIAGLIEALDGVRTK